MIPKDVDRLYILKTRNSKTGVVDSHLAYFVLSSEPNPEVWKYNRGYECPHAVYACDEEPVAMKVECGVSWGYPADEEDMDEFDQYCNEVTCEKCLAIARG